LSGPLGQQNDSLEHSVRSAQSADGARFASFDASGKSAYAGRKDDDTPWGFFSSAGSAFGADYRINDHLAAGLTGGYVGGAATVSSFVGLVGTVSVACLTEKMIFRPAGDGR
jgi:hypothetical protein